MKDQWYGDHRDLVKWGVLVHLATTKKLQRIIQVAYRRRSCERPALKSGNTLPLPVPEVVWAHFRDLQDITRLAVATQLQIVVLQDEFDPQDRPSYTETVLKRIQEPPQAPTLIFLDPDTGIVESNPKPEHVTSAEVREIWSKLKSLDWLVLYQHAHRHKDWIAAKREEFKRAIESNEVETYQADRTPTDVAFFCATK